MVKENKLLSNTKIKSGHKNQNLNPNIKFVPLH